MKYLKIAGGIVGFLAVALVGVGFALPSSVHVERSAIIDAPVCTTYMLVDNFHTFNDFSPWAKIDPTTKYAFEGPAWGKGAKMTWDSTNSDVGKGSQLITAARECERVDIDLDFGQGGIAKTNWTFRQGKDGKTHAVWAFDSEVGNDLVGRYFGLLMDGWIGGDYEKGLAGLKALAEAQPKADLAGLSTQILDVPPVIFVYLETTSGKDPAKVGEALGAAYGQVGAWFAENNVEMAGMPLVVTADETPEGYKMAAGIPVASPPMPPPPEPLKVGTLPVGRAVKIVHKGAYTGLDLAHTKVEAWIAVRKMEVAGPSWEVFATDPGTTPEKDTLTEIWYPIR